MLAGRPASALPGNPTQISVLEQFYGARSSQAGTIDDVSAALQQELFTYDGPINYAYDAQGRRKSKTVGSTTTIYVTDADNREVLEYDATSKAAQCWYAYGIDTSAVLKRRARGRR